MKILLYAGSLKIVEKSGVGQAIRHQQQMLKLMEIPYTMDSREDYDVLQLNTIFPDSLMMSRSAKARGKKVIYYAHSTMEDFKNSFRGSNHLAGIFKRWIIHCYSSGDVILTPTEYSKNILESYGLKKPIYSLSNGIDTKFFTKDTQGRRRFREKYHIAEEDKVVISVGHYIERKGLPDFVQLAALMPEYTFYWFGYTNLSLVTSKIKRALQHKLPNLHFPGYIDRNALKDAYSGSDLFAFLTYEETEGIVLLEALSAKIPVLIRDIPIYAHWLKEGETVYKGKNIMEFKAKISGILEKKLPDLTENGHKLAMERDFSTIGKKLLEIYKSE